MERPLYRDSICPSPLAPRSTGDGRRQFDRKALRANLVERAQDWRWCGYGRRISVDRESLLSSWPRDAPGAFAPFTQQPALQALLLPFAGYGSVQLVEYLINL